MPAGMTKTPKNRRRYERALLALRGASQALLEATRAAVEATRQIDDEPMSPFVAGISLDIRETLTEIAAMSDGMKQAFAVAALHGHEEKPDGVACND